MGMIERGPIRVLCMEDDSGIARLIQKTLDRAGYEVDIAGNGREGLELHDAGTHDVLLVDQSMPLLEGLEVLRMLSLRKSTVPVIMITGHGDERVAVEAMKLGARDYIVKDVSGNFLELLPTVVHRVLEQQWMMEEKLRAESALRESEKRLDSIIKSVPDIIYRLDPRGGITFISDAVTRYGYSPGELMSRDFLELIHPEDRESAVYRVNERRSVKRNSGFLELRILLGEDPALDLEPERVFLITAQGLYGSERPEAGTFIGTQGIARDITERKRAEEEREKLLKELQEALAQVKTLSGLIPICASCKKIRDDNGYWNQLEKYISTHSDAKFSHGICPECAEKLYGDLLKKP